MKKLLFIALLILMCNISYTQNLLWVKAFDGIQDAQGAAIAIDDFGNVYTTGLYNNTTDFDPGPGVFNLPITGSLFISKLDSNGNFLWAKSIAGTFSNLAPMGTNANLSIAVDNLSNVYITGDYLTTTDFDPGPGVNNLTAFGSGDIFILKLNSNGDFVWANGLGLNYGDYGNSIALDNSGNVYTTGSFSLTVDFDPGVGIYNLAATGGSSGGQDVFILKLDTSGAFVWAKRMGGLSNDEGHAITIDNTGNVYTTGYFTGNVDFDPGGGTNTLFSAGDHDVFVSKLNSAGNFVWARNMGGATQDWSNSIATDNFGNVYTTGFFSGTADFDPSVATNNLITQGFDDIFISKLNAFGNFVWAKSMGSTSFDKGNSIAIDNDGNVYSAGDYNGTVDFDPGAGIYNLNSGFGAYTYISKLDASGNFLWANNLGGSHITSITTDSSNNIYTTGWYTGTVDFDPDSGVAIFPIPPVVQDVFIHKMGDCTTSSSYALVDNGSGNYTFTNTSTGNFTQSHWAFGDGTTSTSTSPNHTFTTNGLFSIVLTINDSASGSCYDYYIGSINVTGVPAPLQCSSGFVMYPDTATGTVTVVNSATGSNLTHLWDFGDGNTSTLQNPSYSYTTAGPFYLCLTVNDGAGCIDMYCDSIGANGVVFKQAGFTINVIGAPTTIGIESINKDLDIMIYPIPNDGTFTINLDQLVDGTKIEVINSLGQQIWKLESITDLTIPVMLKEPTPGVYFIKISSVVGVNIQKVVIK
jgi:PKD repeat protein